MIATVSGIITEKREAAVVVEAAGIGYLLVVTPQALETMRHEHSVKLHVYEHIREDAHDLYGFEQLEEKALFELLISVNGVGPKMAIQLMSLGGDKLSTAIASSDFAMITSVSGVGKRLAERLVVDLKDKIGVLPGTGLGALRPSVREALISLGFSDKQISEVLHNLNPDDDEETQVKHALKLLGGDR